jgi:hypothetical protein
MASFVAVDHDPFAPAGSPPSGGGKGAPRFVPVDHDPFATSANPPGGEAASPSGFATRAQREGGDPREGEYLADAVRTRIQQDKSSPMGRLDAYARGVAGWVPGMNKLAAAGDAAFGSGQGETFGERYSDNLMRERALDDADRALNPGSRLAGQTGGFAATAAILPAVNALKAGVRGAPVINGALTGALYGGAERGIEADGTWGNKAIEAAEGAASGAVVGGVATAALGAVGNRLGRRPVQAAVPEYAQAADELGIRLTAGQRAADPAVLSTENAMAGGGMGAGAQRVAQEAIEAQRGQILTARDQIGQTAGRGMVDLARPADAGGIVGESVSDFATRAQAQFAARQARLEGSAREASDAFATRFNPLNMSPVEAGGTVAEATRTAATQGRQGYQQAYRDTFAREGQIAPEFFTGLARPGSQGVMAQGSPLNDFAAPLSQRITESLVRRAEPIIPDQAITPIASRTLAELDRVSNLNLGRIGNPGAGETLAGVNLRGLEQARKIITSRYQSARAVPEDARAMRGIIEAFDDQVERVFSSSLFSGDETALQAIREARGAFSAWQRTFRPQGAGDDAGRAIQRIVERNATDEEAANYILGAARTGDSGLSVRLYDRLQQALGVNSPEFQSIRGAAWQKLTGGLDAGDPAGARRLAERIREFTDQRGSSLAERMFRPQELEAMRRYSSTLQAFAARAAAKPNDMEAQGAVKTLIDVANRNLSPEDMASTIFGFGNKASTFNVRMVDAIGDVIGKDGPEWAAIRQGIWQRITGVAEGNTEMGAQRLSQRVNEFVNGEGKSLATRLFSPAELNEMRKFSMAIRATVPPSGTTNPSNSGNRAAALARQASSAVAAMLGASSGGPIGAGSAVVMAKGGTMLADARQAARARQLYSGEQRGPSIAARLTDQMGRLGDTPERALRLGVTTEPAQIPFRLMVGGSQAAASDGEPEYPYRQGR